MPAPTRRPPAVAGRAETGKIEIIRGDPLARNEKTSDEVASAAGRLLHDPHTPKAVRSIAGSALTQAPDKKKAKKR